MSFLGTSKRPLRRTGFLSALALGTVAAIAPAAFAAPEVALLGTKIKYVAAKGNANVITLSYDSGDDIYTITDTGVTNLAPGKGCFRPSGAPSTEVACPTGIKPVKNFYVNSNDLNDEIRVEAPINGIAVGGNGNDLIETGAEEQKIVGGSGSDTMDGGPGSDRINGGGGTGIDIVSYLSHADPVSVTLRNRQSDEGNAEDIDPRTGRLDVVSQSVEGAIGSQAADDFTGTPTGRDIFDGGPGDDEINGLAGSDILSGGADDDTILTFDITGGTAEGDKLDGGPGNDTLTSSSGNDELIGGAGFDSLSAGSGNDQVRSNEGSGEPPFLDEAISCGAGIADRLFYDQIADFPLVAGSECEDPVPIEPA